MFNPKGVLSSCLIASTLMASMGTISPSVAGTYDRSYQRSMQQQRDSVRRNVQRQDRIRETTRRIDQRTYGIEQQNERMRPSWQSR